MIGHSAWVPDEMTNEELDAIEARAAAAATKGLWKAYVEGRDRSGGYNFIRTGGLDNTSPDMCVTLSFASETVIAPQSDLDFIVASRQDVLRLVNEVRRLRGT